MQIHSIIDPRIEKGTAQGQMMFWDGTRWVHTEVSELFWDDTAKQFTARGIIVTGGSVLGLNSVVFQPNADSTTFLQVLDAAGTQVVGVDTTNGRMIIGEGTPSYSLEIYDATEAEINFNTGSARVKRQGINIFSANSFGTWVNGPAYIVFQINGVEKARLDSRGFLGFNETIPETLLELTHAQPYLTLHNSTHEDSDGGRESRLNFKGEQSGGQETTLARMEVGHDGTGDDQKGYLDIFINDGDDGDSPTKQLRLDSTGLTLTGNLTMPDGGTIGQAAGPLLTFDDTNDRLGITGCSVNIGAPFFFENPLYELQLAKNLYNTTSTTRLLISGGRKDTGQPCGHFIQSSQIGDVTGSTFAIVEAIGNYSPREALLGTTRFFIDKDGKIGFNTVTPDAKFELAGDMLFTGASSGLPFGEISVVSNATETAIASQNVYVQITTFDTNGESLNVTPDHTNDHLTITKAGRYFISCSITLNSVGGAGSIAEMEVKKNNGTSRVGSLHVDRTLAGGGAESGAITLTGIAVLAVDDTIEVWIKNETNTQNYVVEDITLSLTQIGG